MTATAIAIKQEPNVNAGGGHGWPRRASQVQLVDGHKLPSNQPLNVNRPINL